GPLRGALGLPGAGPAVSLLAADPRASASLSLHPRFSSGCAVRTPGPRRSVSGARHAVGVWRPGGAGRGALVEERNPPLRGLRRLMARYRKLLAIEVRISLALAAQYRFDFAVQGAMMLFWLGWSLVPLLVVFGARPRVAGWSFDEALVVMGWFTILRAV